MEQYHSHDHQGHDHSQPHEHSLYGELICHFPYAVFSVAFSLLFLSLLTFFTPDMQAARKGFHVLFHAFHYMHIVFAATGTLIMFLRYSKNMLMALLVGIISPIIFCTLSDVILPYVAGQLLGVDMHLHLCFVSEWRNIVPFLIGGIINGFVMSMHHQGKQGLYSLFSHVAHITVSALASTFYLVSQRLFDWYAHFGMIFILLIIAVVVPCTLSDVVVPMSFANWGRKS